MFLSLKVSLSPHTAGFTPDVKIWEVEFSKAGDYQQVRTCVHLHCGCSTMSVLLWVSTVEMVDMRYLLQVSRAMELKGHDASVLSLGFNGDSHR